MKTAAIDNKARTLPDAYVVCMIRRHATIDRELAVVYVSISPNPTSGCIEFAPLVDVAPTDGSVQQAMRIIVTGAANAPGEMRFTHPVASADSVSEAI